MKDRAPPVRTGIGRSLFMTTQNAAPELLVDRWFNTDHPLTLSGLRGRVVVLAAFQVLCPNSIASGVPQARRIYETFAPGDVAVIGMPDERLGEKVCVYVVLAESSVALTLKDVTDYLRAQRLATQKLPERLEIASALPMTATGKVQKHILRADIKQKLG